MSRSNYHNDLDECALIRWRGAVRAAIKGRRGQAFLRELLAALQAMPKKELIASELVTESGDVCAIGAVCKARGLDLMVVDEHDTDAVASTVGIAQAMAREIAYVNDECGPAHWQGGETPAARFERVLKWAASQIKP